MSSGRRIKGFAALALVVALAAAADAAPWDRSQRLAKVTKSYDATRPETVAGTVADIYEVTPANSPAYGYHLVLQTEKELLNIHLGPGWYLKDLIGGLKKGDLVEISGARSDEPIAYKGQKLRAVRAAEVRRDGAVVLHLREESGKPAWSGM